MSYAKNLGLKKTPQTQPVLGKKQVANNAGGYVFQIDQFEQLKRFLILGCEGGTYYCAEQKMTLENAGVLQACAKTDLARTLKAIEDASYNAPKISPSIFSLALLTIDYNVNELRDTFLKVVRTGSHLTDFVENCKNLRGKGKTFKKLINSWYLQKQPKDLAYQLTKYASRNSWSHRDILRCTKPKVLDASLNSVIKYAVKRDEWVKGEGSADAYLSAVEEAKTAPLHRLLDLMEEYNLVREHIPTEHLNNVAVWDQLLQKMPVTAMIRNLGKMSQVGLISPFSEASRKIVGVLTNEEILQRAHIHPFNVLLALRTYGQGCGFRGSNSWTIDQQVLQALDDAFYKSFKFVRPTNKRFYLGIDCSGSMFGGGIAGSPVTPGEGAGAMAMTSVRTEPFTYTAGFNHQMVPINLTKGMDLQSVTNTIARTPWGSTNCALPMLDALEKKLQIDCFIVYTDNETWCGAIHPFQALKQYRDKMGINAKLIVCGMTATGFSIADPSDPGTLDVVGFDSSVPQLIQDFVS